MTMREIPVEERLKRKLEGIGFKVLKLTTAGTAGSMDRMALRPSWSPGPPYFIECKRPGKDERLLQATVRDNWRARGALVLDRVSTYAEVDETFRTLHEICKKERIDGR